MKHQSGLTPLRVALSDALWWAKIGLRPGKLTADDALTMRRLRVNVRATRQGLERALRKVSQAEAAEIEQCVADLIRDTGQIWHLLPIPSPNARDTVTAQVKRAANNQRTKDMRTAKAEKSKAKARNQVCDAEFAKRLKDLPADWDGKDGAWEIARRAMKAINEQLGENAIGHETTVYRRLRKFVKERQAALHS